MPTATADRPGKRERLISSAKDLLHAQGVERTTLAQIAEAADVPVGNVYYYFKTRDELVQAVLDARHDEARGLLAELDKRSTPKARLKALARAWDDQDVRVAEHGCPIGSLSCELSKQAAGPHSAAALFETILSWMTDQFRAMGRRDARELAESMLAGIQGGAVLANALHDSKVMTREARRLERWLDTLG